MLYIYILSVYLPSSFQPALKIPMMTRWAVCTRDGEVVLMKAQDSCKHPVTVDSNSNHKILTEVTKTAYGAISFITCVAY